MKKQINHFLLGIIWLLATALGASFLFNTKFGFNIFSGAHWQYFAQLQATGEHINTWFYILIILTIFITIVGLYLFMNPRFRKINMDLHNAPPLDQKPVPVLSQTNAIEPNNMRPPRLNLEKTNDYIIAENTQTNIITTNKPVKNNSGEISEIFKSAGYTVKKPPKINGAELSLCAIGANESIWIGCENIDVQKFQDIINRLESVFTETLEDIKININSFMIDENATSDTIKIYKTIAELRKKLPENEKITDEDRENFDAYSEYIDTVTDYLSKL